MNNTQTFSGLSLVNKDVSIQYTAGLGCGYTAKYLVNDQDREVLQNKVIKILNSFKNNPFPAVGYITMKSFADEVLIYYNYSNWLFFITFVSKSLFDHFLQFNQILSILRTVVEQETEPKLKIEELKTLLAPILEINPCNQCPETKCTTGTLNQVLLSQVPELHLLND